MILSLLLALWHFGEAPASASRSIFVPSYARRVGAQWVTTNIPGTTIGYTIQFQYRISNISNVTQTGSIRFITGTSAVANQDIPGSAGIRSPSFEVKYLLCTGGPAVSKGSAFAVNGVNPTSIPPATWVLPAQSSLAIGAMAVFRSSFSNNVAGPGHSAADSVFEPVVELTVNEDRGAVVVTSMTFLQGLAGNFTLCDGSTVNLRSPDSFPYTGVDIPLLVNGGRPF